MSDAPHWLPACLSIDPWTNDKFDMLYEVFTRDLKSGGLTYGGTSIWFFPEMEDGKETIFWHLTSRMDKASGTRMPDFRRCERLCWPRPMLDNHSEPEILAWDFEEDDGAIKTYVWVKDDDFLVLLKKMKNGTRRLLTSFWIEYENYREKLMKKYEKRVV